MKRLHIRKAQKGGKPLIPIAGDNLRSNLQISEYMVPKDTHSFCSGFNLTSQPRIRSRLGPNYIPSWSDNCEEDEL